MIYVIPLDDGYKSSINERNLHNTDFLMSIFISSCGKRCPTVAAAAYLEVENKFNRPVVGVDMANARVIPKEASNYNSKDSTYFYVHLHEIFHALGITRNYFPKMHPHEEIKPYDEIYCNFTKYGRNFSFLVTPMCHRFAVNQFGVEEFEGDNGVKCPAGIELESGGGEGTKGSHLKERVYMSDVMVGMVISLDKYSFSRLTDATLAVLIDTGNYKVNWTMAQPLVWGHPESINGKHIKDFALGAPQLVYPENYVINIEKPDFSMFDFKGYGVVQEFDLKNASQINCSLEDNKDICTGYDSFINPKKSPYISVYSVFDYNLFKTPNTSCPEGTAAIHGNVINCFQYECDGYNSVNFSIPNFGNITCDKNSIGKEYTNEEAKVWCPDPEKFCRSIKLREMHFKKNPFIKNVRHLENTGNEDDSDVRYFDPSYATEGDGDPTKDNSKTWLIVGIVCGAIVVICIIIGVVLYIKKSRSDSNNNNDEVEQP